MLTFLRENAPKGSIHPIGGKWTPQHSFMYHTMCIGLGHLHREVSAALQEVGNTQFCY